jgi:hypothetical protein
MNHDVSYLKDESYLINFGKTVGVDFKRIILSEFLFK